MSRTQQAEKTSTGTAQIVWGSVLMAWGLVAAIRSIAVMDGYALVGLIPLAFGVWLLVAGLNRRRSTR